MKAFNTAFAELAKLGKVGVGRTLGRFKAKAVVAVAFNEKLQVTGAFLMKGYTVFSRPEPIPELLGLRHQDIDVTKIFPNKPNYQQALQLAIRLD